MAAARVTIQTAALELAALQSSLQAGRGEVGAVACFTGYCRNHNDGQYVTALVLEHYPGMTERAIEGMIDTACARFDILDARVAHRVGPIALGEAIVWVGVASAHRQAALDACAFLMDYLKTQAPFWKKETLADGQSRWVDARVADDAALARWGIEARNAA